MYEYGLAFVSQFRPLSTRGKADPKFDALHEGLPPWMGASVRGWVGRFFESDVRTRLAELENALHVDPPLDWPADNEAHALFELIGRIQVDDEFGLDVLDYLLCLLAQDWQARELSMTLVSGGSAWEVTPDPNPDGDGWQLTRRAVGPVVESIDAIRTPSQRAHHHLTEAWKALMGRNPNPSTAYSEAIKGVEAAAKPVVTPNDPLATLGKIIRALRDNPAKWVTVLDKSSPQQIAEMADLVWKGQLDRHGTDDPSAPLSVTQEEADAAFRIALALVGLFVSGGIKPAS